LFSLCVFYGFFLSMSKPTMAIAMIMAITATAIPSIRSDVVAMFPTGVEVGISVGCALLA